MAIDQDQEASLLRNNSLDGSRDSFEDIEKYSNHETGRNASSKPFVRWFSGSTNESRSSAPRKGCAYGYYIVRSIFALSLLMNIIQYVCRIMHPPAYTVRHFQEESQYAGLTTEIMTPFEWHTPYTNTNLTEAGELWEAISFDVGMVALSNEWTEAHELPIAQPFPWDREKGIYVLNGYHALHCLQAIHRTIRDYEAGRPRSMPLLHITHCLGSLRSDVICNADDTPRYTTPTKTPESAEGQLRKCKDWSKLEAWAQERSSCYRYFGPEADHIDQFERFKFCPPDSPYWPKVRKHFGKADDWTPSEDEVRDILEEIKGAGTHSHS